MCKGGRAGLSALQVGGMCSGQRGAGLPALLGEGWGRMPVLRTQQEGAHWAALLAHVASGGAGGWTAPFGTLCTPLSAFP